MMNSSEQDAGLTVSGWTKICQGLKARVGLWWPCQRSSDWGSLLPEMERYN